MPRVLPLLSLAFGVALALAGLAIVTRSTEGGAFPGANGKIAFYSPLDGDYEIYVVNPDGSGRTQLTDHPASDFDPAWSADGSKIAFASDRDGTFDLYSMNADGTGLTKLTADGGPDRSPSWSPDGTKIAFVRSGDIHVLTIGVSPPANLTFNPFVNEPDGAPAWSPDGTKIAFHSDRFFDDLRPHHPELYVMNADGTGVTGPLAFRARDPSWSPDGSKLAFTKLAPVGPEFAGIAVVNADGTGEHALPTESGQPEQPAWSPDGARIAFSGLRKNPDLVFAILATNADGSCVVQITGRTSLSVDYAPDWQPLPAPQPTPAPPLFDPCITVVGGFAADLPGSAADASLEASESSGSRSGVLVAVVALATAAAVVGAGAWYARRRRAGR